MAEAIVGVDSGVAAPAGRSGDSGAATHQDGGGTRGTAAGAGSPTTGKPGGGTQQGADAASKRVADTDAALKAKQADLTRTSQELAKLDAELTARRAALDELSKARDRASKPTEMVDPMEDKAFREKLSDLDPIEAQIAIARAERRYLAGILESRDAALKDEFGRTLSARTDPERAKLSDTISELSGKAWFANLDPAQQLQAARDYAAAKPKGDDADTFDPPATSPAGTGRSPGRAQETADERQARLREAAAREFGPAPKVGGGSTPIVAFEVEPRLASA